VAFVAHQCKPKTNAGPQITIGAAMGGTGGDALIRKMCQYKIVVGKSTNTFGTVRRTPGYEKKNQNIAI
jgi:hypothetical protein